MHNALLAPLVSLQQEGTTRSFDLKNAAPEERDDLNTFIRELRKRHRFHITTSN